MSENIIPSNKIFSIKEARDLSKKRFTKVVIDIIDGASVDEKLSVINSTELDQIRLEHKGLQNEEKRSLKKRLLN